MLAPSRAHDVVLRLAAEARFLFAQGQSVAAVLPQLGFRNPEAAARRFYNHDIIDVARVFEEFCAPRP